MAIAFNNNEDPCISEKRKAIVLIDRIKKAIWVVLAAAFLIAGALGVVLPLIPTIPFLLAASYFLARLSKQAK